MSENLPRIVELNREKSRTASLSVISNTVLMISKLAVGLLIGSVSVVSEAIHSGVDLVAAIIALISVRKSSEPPDKEHYYGHGKFENISGTVEAVLILVAAILIIREAYLKFVSGVEIENVNFGIIVMIVSVAANFYISHRLFRTAAKTESVALEADAWHLRTDVLTSLGILIGLVIIRFTAFKIIDPIMAIIVALLILRAAVQLILKSIKDLMDVRLPEAEEKNIKDIIQKYSKNYFEFHEMRTRKAGSDRFIDFHLVVCEDANIEDAHALADRMEQEIIQKFPRASVIIHLEPCGKEQLCKICDKTPTQVE